MIEIIKNSLLFRLAAFIGGTYQYSLFGRFFAYLKSSYEQSRLNQVFSRVFGSPATATQSSAYVRTLNELNAFLHRFGKRFRPVFISSLVYRGWSRVYNSNAARNSLLCRIIIYPGFRKILIFAFTMYLPIDYFLRNILSISSIASVWDEGFMLVSLVYIIFDRLFGDQKPNRATPLDMPILLFFAVGIFLVCVVSPFPSIAIAGYRATVEYILWFFIVLRLFKDDSDVRLFYLSLAALGTIIALHGIYQFIVAVPIPPKWQTSTETAVRTRVFSILGSPNLMGSFMVMLAPLTASIAYKNKSLKIKIAAWLCTMLMCMACLFTFSRGAWLGMGVAIIIFALYNDKKLIALLAAAFCVAPMIPDIYNRISFLFTDQFAHASANGGRASRWAIGLGYLYDHSNPIFGFGLGLFGGAVAMQNQVYSWVSYFYVDNYFLKILVEMGYVGITAFAVMLLGMIFTSMRAVYRTKKNGFSPLCAGMLAGLTGVLVHCFYENIFEQTYMMAYFWGIAALIVYLGFIRKQEA